MKKKLVVVLVSLVLLVLVAVGIDRLLARSVNHRVHAVRIGDSKTEVERLLGHPTKIFVPMPDARTNLVANILSVEAETWAYGSSLDLSRAFHSEFPYVSVGRSIRFRFFKPEPDDVAIAFDSSGRVSGIRVP